MFYKKLVFLIGLIISSRLLYSNAGEVISTEIPLADNYLHIYGLPVGQGDAWIIQCPLPDGGLTILDMGSSDGLSKGFWNSFEVKNFLTKSFHLIRNVIITHNHEDHYNILPKVLSRKNDAESISNIYISCTKIDLKKEITAWINTTDKWNHVKVFNNGGKCGPNNVTCGYIDLCPKYQNFPDETRFIMAKVLAANWGQQCNGETQSNKNANSIVISLKVGRVGIMMNGDFEDLTTSESENGPQKDLVKFYGENLRTDIYHVSHHGAEFLANKDIILNATKPKAVMVSSNPFGNHRHPRCSIYDRLINKFKSICMPKPCNQFGGYCCNEQDNLLDIDSRSLDKILQKNFTCGEKDSGLRSRSDNGYAIYSTVPNNETLNMIEFYTDGDKWAFKNIFMKWIRP